LIHPPTQSFFLLNIVAAPENGSDLATGMTVGNVILGPVGLFLFLPTILLHYPARIQMWGRKI
jgi:hypothetical protein